MSLLDKVNLLNDLIEPFGFTYLLANDIFMGRQDAWQRKRGYEALYDKAAFGFRMIFDAWPVYFDYMEKTWLIEFWKGQYGVATGCEIGIYHAQTVVSKQKRESTHFDAVANEEMPYIQVRLEKNEQKTMNEGHHWWLTVFQMGEYSKPEELVLRAQITFLNIDQTYAFSQGLLECGYSPECFYVLNHSVFLTMITACQKKGFWGFYRKLVLFQNQCNCFIYRLITRPYHMTVDCMLYLYFQFPSFFRKCLLFHSRMEKI